MGGTLTLSIEIELGWGVHDLEDTSHLSEGGAQEREYLKNLLQLTDEVDIPISFDIVGHLLLPDCQGTHEGPYPEGWFESDPGSTIDEAPLFYAREMANAVLSSKTAHELCTHTFSHILCDEVSDELVDLELKKVQELHAELDSRVSSFVPPRHKRPSNETLYQNDINVARYAKETYSPTKLHRLKELTIGPHPEWESQGRNGVLETYCTTYPSLTARSLPAGQRSTHPIFKPIPIELRKRVHQRYLRRSTLNAIESDVHLHLWCHLYDLSNRHQWDVLKDYLTWLSTVPDKKLTILTMEELADGATYQ